MSIYYLNNGEEGWEAGRLDWSHHQMVMPLVGNNVLPREIRQELESTPSPAIADICTGTGAWAVSVAKELPNAQIRGFDIDTTKFAQNLPPHVQLQFGDVFSPFPSELLEKFDLVHARFLVSLLRTEDWVPVARNLMTLLRPGGWILWEDSGPFEFRVLPITPGWMRYAKLSWLFCSGNGMDLRMPATLPNHIEDAGFVDLKEKDYHTSPYEKLDVATKESMLRLAYQTFLGMVASGKVEEMRTEAQAKSAVDEIRKEFEQGTLCFWTLKRVWGRRPPDFGDW
ncbi:S-adenosyl-L-methionine-dependent methyltransferase [Astrocystis sublimbata]|nr:S-adenosyl-L-methionine-dependent methyltransferase [Astrocystis sublimbata]